MKQLYIWILEQEDTYESYVVVSESKEKTKQIYLDENYIYDETQNSWHWKFSKYPHN